MASFSLFGLFLPAPSFFFFIFRRHLSFISSFSIHFLFFFFYYTLPFSFPYVLSLFTLSWFCLFLISSPFLPRFSQFSQFLSLHHPKSFCKWKQQFLFCFLLSRFPSRIGHRKKNWKRREEEEEKRKICKGEIRIRRYTPKFWKIRKENFFKWQAWTKKDFQRKPKKSFFSIPPPLQPYFATLYSQRLVYFFFEICILAQSFLVVT